MIHLNVKELCRVRGFRHPLTSLYKAGISKTIAHNYLADKKTTIVIKHVELLCKLLRCTPNDLFVWTPDEPADDYPENPLQAMRKKEHIDLTEALKGMTVGEIEEMVRGRRK